MLITQKIIDYPEEENITKPTAKKLEVKTKKLGTKN
jgi:hypothetical protein